MVEMYQIGAQQGWQCPLCNRIYGPFVQECYNCNNREVTLTRTIGGENNLDLTKEMTRTKDIPQIYFEKV